MNLQLIRKESKASGIYSELLHDDGSRMLVTLEHAYAQPDGSFLPKIIPGTFACRRGMHRLHGMDHDFETFEITGVPGHINLLFHWGNFNKDSEGCVLVGEGEGVDMITASRVAFKAFMDAQAGVDEFTLTVLA